MLFDNSKSEDESVRNVVAECLGLLFFDNGNEMMLFMDEKFGSNSKNVLTTIAKSLKYSVNRNMNSD